MSFWAVNWAAEAKLPVLSEKLVLLLLANFANDEDEAWPRIDTLMDMTCKSKSTVHRLLQSLEAQGFITGMGTREYRENSRAGSVKSVAVIRLNVPDSVHRTRRKMGPRPEVTETNMPSQPVGPKNGTNGESGLASPTSGTQGVPPVGLTYKEEPPYRTTNLTPLPPSGEDAGGEPDDGLGRVGGVSDDDTEPTADGPSVEGWQVLRDCLPRPMQTLDGLAAVRVLALLRERLDAGWNPESIHDTLAGNALPHEVRSLGGLVMHRVKAIPVDGAPTPRTLAGAQRRSMPSEPVGFHPAWMVERCRARLAGDPSAERPALWWAQHVQGPSTVPADQSIETALAISVEQGNLR